MYASSCGNVTTLSKNSNTKFLVTTAAKQLISIRETIAYVKAEMLSIAQQLPEFDTVMKIFGVGKNTGIQLIAEIGDITRFPKRSTLVAFAGLDPAVDKSGKHISTGNPTTKRDSPRLRKILYQIISTYVKRAPADEPVYQFICKKRSEGKPYFVYMTAASNNFLRIYYACVKEVLENSN